MIKITVTHQTLREIPWTDKKGNRQVMLVQTAYAFPVDEAGNVGVYPDKFEIVLARGQTQPHPIGDYTLHPSAVYVDRDGRLAIQPRLTPWKAAAPAPKLAA